jgi:DNA-directed RNA polymerase subunit RPC12/RpoP
MVRIFTCLCPKCKKEFEVHYGELRHRDVKLHCPYCDNWFFLKESEEIDDRW